MSVNELEAGFKQAVRDTFRWGPNFRRSVKNGHFSLINFLGNTAYLLFVKRLAKDTDRFPESKTKFQKPAFEDQLSPITL